MNGLIMAAQLLLSLTILVGLHEFGHYIFARIFKIRVNKFYIFFDFLFPLPHVLNFSLFKKKVGDTEYGLGWFPLGGYVDIAGMIDETKDASQLESEPQPWEFRSKPAWQRLLVMLGGIIVNIVLGMIIFSGVKYYWGDIDYAKDDINKAGVYAYPSAENIGIKTGDKILKVNNEDFKYFSELNNAIVNENSTLTIERDGEVKDVVIPNELINDLAARQLFVMPLLEFEVGMVNPGSPADKAGLKAGDKITSFNGDDVRYYQLFSPKLRSNAGNEIELEINRAGEQITLKPTVGNDSLIGFAPKFLLNVTKAEFTLGQAIVKGSAEALDVIPQQIKGFGRIFKGHISPKNALTGPVGLATLFSPVWDWEIFWKLTGLLSMALAFINAVPIPALDGGHVVLLLYEMITGRKPSEKFVEKAQMVGTFILLALMIYVIFNDTIKLF